MSHLHKTETFVQLYLEKQIKAIYLVNIEYISSHKKFWRRIKPFFSNKMLNPNKLLLVAKGILVSNEKHLANIFNHFFINIILDLELKMTAKLQVNLSKSFLESFKDNPSIKRINTYFHTTRRHQGRRVYGNN